MPSVFPVRRPTNRRAPERLRPPVTPHRQALPHHFRPDGPLPPLPEQFTATTGQPPLTPTRHRILPPLLPLHLAQGWAGPRAAAVEAAARPESSRTAAATGRPAAGRATFGAPVSPDPRNRQRERCRRRRRPSEEPRPSPGPPPASRRQHCPDPTQPSSFPPHRRCRDDPLPPPFPPCPHRGLPVQSRPNSPEPVPLSPGPPLPPTRFPPANDLSSAKPKRRPRAT